MACPRYWWVSAVDASREGDEERLISIHPKQRKRQGEGEDTVDFVQASKQAL